MEAIEIIDYNDSGSEAIKKLDRNQRKIKNHLDTINVDGMQQQINDCLKRENRISSGDIKALLIAKTIKLDTVYLVADAVTNMPALSYYELHVYGADYNSIILVAYDQWSNNQYFARFSTTGMTDITWNQVVTKAMLNNALAINRLTQV